MLRVFAAAATAASVVAGPAVPGSGVTSAPGTRIVATGLKDPYELIMGPDGYLWLTEKSGLTVKRIKPDTGLVSTALDLTGQARHTPMSKDGVLGLALHPDFGKGRGTDHVYLSYTYKGRDGNKTKLTRYTWADGKLTGAHDILTELPSSIDQNTTHGSIPLGCGISRSGSTKGARTANGRCRWCCPGLAVPLTGRRRSGRWSTSARCCGHF